MFKLFSILFVSAVVALAAAEVQLLVPQDNIALLSSSSGKSLQSLSPAAAAGAVAGDGASSDEDDSDSQSNEVDAPSSPSSASSSASAPSPAVSAASNRAALLLASAVGLPAVQHQILPAATIPLPITIAARPGLRTILAPETITVHQPTIAKIGEVVQQIPTAVSHQSQTVVHKHARVVTPIVVPAVRTVTSQVVRAIHQPLVWAPQTRVVSVLNH